MMKRWFSRGEGADGPASATGQGQPGSGGDPLSAPPPPASAASPDAMDDASPALARTGEAASAASASSGDATPPAEDSLQEELPASQDAPDEPARSDGSQQAPEAAAEVREPVESAAPIQAGDGVEPEVVVMQAPLAPGTVVGDRYRIVNPLTESAAADLLGSAVSLADPDPELYAVEDQRGYERCWSCGSTGNEPAQRFCTACGAPLQQRHAVLARTGAPAGEADEFCERGSWFHLVRPRKHFDSAGIAVEIGGYSAEGPHHPNEDSYWGAAAGGCYDSSSSMVAVVALADGMGGYAPGSGLISREIVRLAGHALFSHLHAEADSPLEENDLRAVMKSAIQLANDYVLERIGQSGEMGATLVLVAIFGHTAYIGNVGDSRAYYVSAAGNLTRITRDQSLVEQQVAAGLLSPDAVYTAFGNNVILHAIGEPQVEQVFDWYTQPLEPGGRLVLCSDGYWKTMAQQVWNPELARQNQTLRALARAMVETAVNATDDNSTVVLIGIE